MRFFSSSDVILLYLVSLYYINI